MEEQFDFKETLQLHPNVTLLQVDEIASCPERLEKHKGKSKKFYKCLVEVNEVDYPITVCEPKGFPTDLPYIYLTDPGEHDFHNHINYKGEICYVDNSMGVFIDIFQPQDVLLQSIESVIKVLEGNYQKNIDEFFNEFEGYWISLPDCIVTESFFSPKDFFEKIKIYTVMKSGTKIPLAFYNEIDDGTYAYKKLFNSTQSINAWYLPLIKETFPPTPDCSDLEPSHIYNLSKAMADAEFERFYFAQKNIRDKRSKLRNEYYLFSQPRPEGGKALFGVHMKGYSKRPFFFSGNILDWNAKPLSIQRHYKDYVIERGGGKLSLEDSSVVVFGCGSVGSRIIEQLALSGVGKIVVVDFDTLSVDNIYRHLLGGNYITRYKAESIAFELKKRLPFVDISDENISRKEWFDKDNREKPDIIVDATADFTGIRQLNSEQYVSDNPIPIVYCWLEPYSVGGHAIFADGVSSGCLECLVKIGPLGPFRRSDLVKPYQNIRKDLTGCGGGFSPFSSLDAIKTATIATELVIGHLLGTQENSYKTWLNSDNDAVSEGVELSDYFHRAKEGLLDNIETNFKNENCKICNS